MENYYSILRISKDSPPNTIRKAFLRQSKELHPDVAVHTGVSVAQATKNFQDLNNAYTILNDPLTKREYDRSLQREKVQAAPTARASSASKVSSVPRASTYTRQGQARPKSEVPDPHNYKPPPDYHWAYPKEEGFLGLILVYFGRLSGYNKMGFCMLFVVFMLFFTYQLPLIFSLIFPKH